MIYGTTNVHLVRDFTDLIGIRTLILRQFWQINESNPSAAALYAAKPNVPPVELGMMLMGEQTLKERGKFSTLWTFQGINGNGKSVTFKTRGNSFDYGFEPGFSQVPIQTHKNFNAMRDQFQGYPSNDGTTVIWPPSLSEGGGGGSGTSLSNSSGDGSTNVMFGIQTFFEMDGVYRYRYASTSAPSQNGVGYITSDIPGSPPALDEGRNWLKAPTGFERKGVIFDITEFFWLSRRGGWAEPVYKKGFFQG